MKKIKICSLMVMATVLVLGGCQKTPDIPVVTQKKSPQEAKPAALVEGMKIQNQIKAPEKYQAVFKDKKEILTVNIDADVVIPDAEGFKLKKVEGRPLNQEDLDIQVEVLFNNSQITQRVYKEDDPAAGWSKPELEERITIMKAKKAEGIDFSEYYEEGFDIDAQIAEMEAMYEAAPETAETQVREPVIEYNPDLPEDELYLDENKNLLMGDVKVDGHEYFFTMTNAWSDSWRWVQNAFRRSGETSNYMEIWGSQSEQNELPLNLEPEEAKKKGDELVKKLGFTDMEIAGEEYYATMTPEPAEIINGEQKPKKGYGLHYTRMVDGIPITYTADAGANVEEVETSSSTMGSSDDGYSVSWPYEQLNLVYDDEGLASFSWENPYVISELSDDYVFMLSFDEIKQIFQQMIVMKNADLTEYLNSAQFDIYEIRLGYGRIMEKGKPGVGTLIPVWDFFGTQTLSHPDQTEEDGTAIKIEESKNDFPYLSLLTINAIDGTVIDRGLGY